MVRTLLAFLVSPLVAAAPFIYRGDPSKVLLWAYGASCFFGVPLFLALKRKGRETHLRYAIGGALAANFLMIAGAFTFRVNGPQVWIAWAIF